MVTAYLIIRIRIRNRIRIRKRFNIFLVISHHTTALFNFMSAAKKNFFYAIL